MQIQQEQHRLIPHNFLTIELNDLCYSANEKKGKTKSTKEILKGVNVEFKSGHLTAIIGPSGAGKTTLLNILSGFRNYNFKGNITLNGETQNYKDLRGISSYIPQEFDMHPLLTTRETLLIAADLKLDSNHGQWKKISMVNEIIELLGIKKIENTFVGKISGGEKKRLSIGIELLTNPPVMLFDEPTSGLDSSSSLQVISHLKSLAESGRLVICSVHQPSSRLFEMFDDVVVLAEGQCFYCGPVNEMTTAFEKANLQCPRFYNPADFAIEVVSRAEGELTKPLSVFKKVAESDISTEECPLVTITFCKSENLTVLKTLGKRVSRDNGYPVKLHKQFCILLRRTFLCTMRDMHMAWLRTGAHVVVALLLGFMYYGMGNEASKTSSNVACIFFFIMFLFFSNSMPTILTFPVEATVFQREYLNNWYSLAAYYSAKVVAEIPLQVICPTLFICSGYFLTYQPYEGPRLVQFWILCLLTTVLGQTLGLAIGAIFDAKLGVFLVPASSIPMILFSNVYMPFMLQLGVFLVPASSIPMILFSGFFMKLQDFPWYLEWLSYVSYFRYAFEGAMQCIYGYDRQDLECSVAYCHFKSSRKILEEFGMENASYEFDVCGLAVWIIVLQITLFVGLKLRIIMS